MARRSASAAVVILVAICVTSIQARDVRVADGTKLTVKLLQFISSETSRSGDPVRFEVADDLRSGGEVVVRRGTAVAGVVEQATPFRLGGFRWLWWGRPRVGRLVIAAIRTEAIDGQPIRLRSLENRRIRESRPPLLRWSHEGEIFNVSVDGDYVIRE